MYQLASVAVALQNWISITFMNEADIVLWVSARVIKNFHSKQYLFTVQCMWWLSALMG